MYVRTCVSFCIDEILPAATSGQKRSAPGGMCTPEKKSRKEHSKGTQEGTAIMPAVFHAVLYS